MYLSKRIRDAFGNSLQFLPNAKAAVVYPERTSPKEVIASLRVIISDLELRAEEAKTP